MTTTDPLAEAVEAAELAIRQRMRANAPVGDYVRVPTHSEIRTGLEAAAPLLREQTLAPIRALCEAQSEPPLKGMHLLVSATDIRKAMGDPA